MLSIIEFIQTNEPLLTMKLWKQSAATLATNRQFISARLYGVITAIKNVHYQLVSIQTWQTTAEKQRDELSSNEISKLSLAKDDQIECIPCQLHTYLHTDNQFSASNVFMINPFEISGIEIPEVLAMWDKAKDYMSAHKGFVKAELFQTLDVNKRYKLINIAEWRNARLFMAALENTKYSRLRQQSNQYTLHPSLCKLVAKT